MKGVGLEDSHLAPAICAGGGKRRRGIYAREKGPGNLCREKVSENLCREKVSGNLYRWRKKAPGIFTGGGKGAGDGKRCREFVRPVGKGLVTGDYQ